ncbi:MAG TPA: hypothetical protein VIT45_18530 [Allosphingosinicella sp.]
MRASKGIMFAAAAALLTVSFAGPADARRGYRHHHDDGVDVDDVVAGAALVGGIAAIASAITRAKREKQDRAVGDCSDEAEFRGEGRVADILRVQKAKGYYTVEGIVERDGGSESFLCTVRNGRIYSFRSGPAEI